VVDGETKEVDDERQVNPIVNRDSCDGEKTRQRDR
jgi:hypothetical protein